MTPGSQRLFFNADGSKTIYRMNLEMRGLPRDDAADATTPAFLPTR